MDDTKAKFEAGILTPYSYAPEGTSSMVSPISSPISDTSTPLSDANLIDTTSSDSDSTALSPMTYPITNEIPQFSTFTPSTTSISLSPTSEYSSPFNVTPAFIPTPNAPTVYTTNPYATVPTSNTTNPLNNTAGIPNHTYFEPISSTTTTVLTYTHQTPHTFLMPATTSNEITPVTLLNQHQAPTEETLLTQEPNFYQEEVPAEFAGDHESLHSFLDSLISSENKVDFGYGH